MFRSIRKGKRAAPVNIKKKARVSLDRGMAINWPRGKKKWEKEREDPLILKGRKKKGVSC